MRYVLRKEIKNRIKIVKFEKRNNFFKAMLRVHSVFVPSLIFQGVFVKFSRDFLSRAKNRCKFTFSKHSIIRFYHLNRNVFRSNASFSTFFGLQKSSW